MEESHRETISKALVLYADDWNARLNCSPEPEDNYFTEIYWYIFVPIYINWQHRRLTPKKEIEAIARVAKRSNVYASLKKLEKDGFIGVEQGEGKTGKRQA